MNPRINPPPILPESSLKATRKTVLKVRYLRHTISMGSKGNPMKALSTTEISHLGDEWRVRRRSKVMFRVRDKIATSQSEP
jgi:hypothetical protein